MKHDSALFHKIFNDQIENNIIIEMKCNTQLENFY